MKIDPELLILPNSAECIVDLYASQVDSSLKKGVVDHRVRVSSLKVLEPLYNEHGQRMGHQVVYYDPSIIEAMYNKIQEINNRPFIKLSCDDDLPF